MVIIFVLIFNMFEEIVELFKKQYYVIVGYYSGVKFCYWFKESFIKGCFCYKQKFYGIVSYCCFQMMFVLVWCIYNCIFCWCLMEGFLGIEFFQFWDDLVFIVEESIKVQRKFFVGYKGNFNVLKEKFEEVWNLKYVVISFFGELMFYFYMGDFVEEFYKRGFIIFIVINGIFFERFEEMKREDKFLIQFYVLFIVLDFEIYNCVNVFMIFDGWERIKEFFRFMSDVQMRIVIRLIFVKGENMYNLEGYVKFIRFVNLMFVEVKVYMFVGFLRNRFMINNMLRYEEIRVFVEELVKYFFGYYIEDEYELSRVVFIMRDDVDLQG